MNSNRSAPKGEFCFVFLIRKSTKGLENLMIIFMKRQNEL